MFGLKSNLRVGLDIGSHAVKMVVAEKAGHGHQKLVKAIGRDIYSGKEKYDADGPKKAAVVPLILEMFQELGIRPRSISHLATCLSGSNMATKELRTLQLPEEEMNSSVIAEARKHLPLDGSESLVDYMMLGEDQREMDKLRVLVAATTKRTFDAHLDVLRELELKPGVVDLEPLAAVNSYIATKELPDEGVVVFLNLGARRTTMVILGRKDMFFSRDLPVGGFMFTDAIMKTFDVSFGEAEELKRTKGLSGEAKQEQVAQQTGALSLRDKTPLEKLNDEINRSLRYYVKETGQAQFVKFVLLGGPAESEELCESLAAKFSVPVEAYDPFSAMDGAPDVKNRSQFAAAVGLAARAHAIY
ncbi:type IV pilus assembly protein PilM [bacterium]|nr:type IV pilus assembly protein PilM [bacterium]RQV96642.1 MAG: type IV pilus assembly protein PilM [bacterium]